jgi:hypothetical protein
MLKEEGLGYSNSYYKGKAWGIIITPKISDIHIVYYNSLYDLRPRMVHTMYILRHL